jgi:hypothetical protein
VRLTPPPPPLSLPTLPVHSAVEATAWSGRGHIGLDTWVRLAQLVRGCRALPSLCRVRIHAATLNAVVCALRVAVVCRAPASI